MAARIRSALGDRAAAASSGACPGRAAVSIGATGCAQVIGRGGSSVVHRAVGAGAAAIAVAVKIAADRARRRRAAELLCDQERRSDAIRHPSVLPVLDAGDGDGRPYLVMPLVEGSDLSMAVAAGALTVGRMLVALRRSPRAWMPCTGPAAAPGRQAGERAARPGRRAGGRRGPRLSCADLGLCRSRDQAVAAGRDRGGFSGSPRYASPEQLDGGPVCARGGRVLTDLPALRVPGRPPAVRGGHGGRPGGSPLRPPAVARGGSPGCPASIDAVIARGLAPDPADRHGSCGQLVSDAGAVLIA